MSEAYTIDMRIYPQILQITGVSTGSNFLLSPWERLGEGAKHSDRVIIGLSVVLPQDPVATAPGTDPASA